MPHICHWLKRLTKAHIQANLFMARLIFLSARWWYETLVAGANCRLVLASVIEKSINNPTPTIFNSTMSLSLFTWGEYREFTEDFSSPAASGDNLSSRLEWRRNIRYHSTPAERHSTTRSRNMPLEPQVSSKGLLCNLKNDELSSQATPRSSDAARSSSSLPLSGQIRKELLPQAPSSYSHLVSYFRWPEKCEKKRNSLNFFSIWQWMKTAQ